MELSTLVSELCSDVHRDHGLNEEDAERLFTAMLEADLAPFEMGAVLMAYRFKGEAFAVASATGQPPSVLPAAPASGHMVY